ncbi:MAG: c-type cytochrome [Candidatus Solibacter usitatus]|nr:c-type cytochrome [Candidatus Solibacter usitatus]
MLLRVFTPASFFSVCGWAGRVVVCLAVAGFPMAGQYGDARRGVEILSQRNCTQCHSLRGAGGTTAPDLARRSSKEFTPATMSATMWNHGPVMWRAMESKGLEVPPLGVTEIADLYAHFYSIRYFDHAGDAGRGKSLFTSKKCGTCHALTSQGEQRRGPPVSQWPAIADRIRWTAHLWNHSAAMMAEMEKSGIRWPTFTVQEMIDLLVWVRNMPGKPDASPALVFDDPAAGEKLFTQRGCDRCHTMGVTEAGKIDLVGLTRDARTFTELGARMWNHLPQMRSRAAASKMDFPVLSENEMSQLIAFLFAKRYFEEKGQPARGGRLFASRKCGACHDQSGVAGPSLKSKAGQFSAPQMASAVWQHGPKMLSQMEKQGVHWPTFTGPEMADLIAFLNHR